VKLWTKWLIVGIVSLAFGLFILANPVAASIAVTTLAGILFAIAGVVQILAGLSEEGLGSKILGLGIGILMLLLGGSLMFNPLEGIISLAALVAILFAVSGLGRVFTSRHMRGTQIFWPMLLSGAFSILLAIYIFMNFFEVAPSLLGVLLGVELIFNGAGLIAFSMFLRSSKAKVSA
jgi:uncharacterized membrane protein HdeD (DUF308 family)